MKNFKTTRRDFIKTSLTATGSLSLAVSLPGCQTFHQTESTLSGSWEANAWLEITQDNQLIFTLDRVEMGQGTYTGLTTLIAEELDTPPELFTVKFAPADTRYRNPDYGLQLTGGSNSLSSSWETLRETGALAKYLLLNAASDVFQVPVSHLNIENKHVIHIQSQKKLSFGELTLVASKVAHPKTIPLKDKMDYVYIGKNSTRTDAKLKVLGNAVYGIDIDIQNTRYAVISRAPLFASKIIQHDGNRLVGFNGVRNIVEIKNGLAIVADTYWQARKAQAQINIQWENKVDQLSDIKEVFSLYERSAEEDKGDKKHSSGKLTYNLKLSKQIISSVYKTPFLAHATMEPMNCTAHVQADRVDIWTSTQAPDVAAVAVAKVTDVSLADVHIHNQFIGGGFGRRLSQDFVSEAAEISAKTGEIIKVVWSREEDLKHDLYRPASLHRINAGLDENGLPLAWDHQIVAPNIMDWYIWDASPAMFPWSPKFMYKSLGKVGLLTAGTPVTPADTSAYEGADDIPYDFPAIEVRHTKADAGIPVSYWRSVGHSHTAFAVESMISELAEKAGEDEMLFRKRYLKNDSRSLGVLQKVAELGSWGKPSRDDIFQGIAVHKSFGSYVAELVELSIHGKEIKLETVYCVIDCGQVVNPDIVKMQMESCIIFGATAALFGEITFKEGRVEQSNFHDYPMMRFNQSPDIIVSIIDSYETPTGVGEPGLPPLAPAIASALYRATNQRYREMPFRLV